MLQIVTRSADETHALGRVLGQVVRPGDVLGLHGPLGAGKTVLVRGIAEGLGADPERVRSPSFTLMVTYEGGRLPLHHLDLFRLEPTEDDRLALREVLFGSAVSAIEWFERFGEELEHLALQIDLAGGPAAASDERRISFRASGDHYLPLVEAVRLAWA